MNHELTPWGMFLAADTVVKMVMIGLVLASVATWTVLAAKTWELRRARARVLAGRHILSQATGLTDAATAIGDTSPVSDMVQAAAHEMRLSAGLAAEGIKDRVASRLDDELTQLARALSAGTGILASIGSVGPFVGLFGTVWGIMNSFIGIAHSQTTNLAVVAPGIAEALLATGMGLVAAIPAVVIYNAFARSIAGVKGQAGLAAAEILRLAGRDLDRQTAAFRRAAE